MRLRECLIAFAEEVSSDDLVPGGAEAPKAADVVAWANLLIEALATGSRAKQLRSYLRKLTRETWDYVNWLTHAKSAAHYDAEIGVAAVSHLLATCTAARLRWAREGHRRCGQCGSYGMSGERCQRCGWLDPGYQAPPHHELSDEELAARLTEPCTPTSDIATLITVDDAIRDDDGG
jgi:hypothetical protein